MLDAGGGGYGGTDWNSKDVRFMWAAIANQETDPHYEVVQGWRRTADLTLTHLGQVRMYRDNLASVWPPSKSPASAAYIERLDKLIANLQATHDAAAANYTAFSTVTLTLSLARTKLKPILEQYEANEQLNLDWQAKQDEAAAKAPTPLTPQFVMPPVSAARQEQLNNEARVIMFDLSSTVISGRSALVKPDPYKPGDNGGKTEGSRRGSEDEGSGFTPPPIIPPPGSSSNSAAGSGSGGVHTVTSGSLTHPPQSSSNGTPHIPGTHGPVGTGGSGPVLGGIGQSPVLNPPVSGPVNPPSTAGTPLPNTSGSLPGVIGPAGNPIRPAPGTVGPAMGRPFGGGALKPGGAFGPTGRPAMPSGTVIGGSGGFVGQTPPASLGRGGAVARPNPVGGVIGQPGTNQPGNPLGRGGTSARITGGAGNAAAHGSQLVGQPGRRSKADRNSPEGHTWDPDNPWATDEGVDPVLLPPEEAGPIDPGPAIGYHR